MVNREDAGSGERRSEPAKIEPLEPGELLQRIEALERLNAELVRQNADLRAELERLRRRQHRQAAPFSRETLAASPKRPGRKPGEGRFTYRVAPPVEALSEPPIAVPVTERACPHCGGVLVEDGMEVASITDLPAQPRPLVRQYQVTVCHCRSCGRSVRGRHPDLAADQYGATAHRLGPRILATSHALHYGQGLPQRKVPAVLEALTGARVTQGALMQDARRRADGSLGHAYQALRTSLAQAERVHTDDTGWRVGGRPAQLMGFTTETTTVYQIRRQHRNREVREVIPAEFAGVLCSDRGKSYDARELQAVRQQKCLCHLQRSVSELLETKWGRGRSFGLQLRRLLTEAIALWHAERDGTVTDFVAQAARLQTRLTDILRERPMLDPSNQYLLGDLQRRHAHGDLLRFLDDPRIEPTNNRAERALRPAVIARKVSQCSKNQHGADAFAAFASVTRTLIQRGHSPIDGLVDVFRGAPLPP
jgi:transposase